MRIALLLVVLILPATLSSWGFFAHQKINRLAVFTLPPEMVRFYKHHIHFLSENAIKPDQRRYVMKNEAPRHFIDIDVYGDSAVYKMPRRWVDAVALYSEDTLLNYGIVPYHVKRVSSWLIRAFQEKDTEQILRLSSDLGHYIADANVPLHTTKNYNGQLTGQIGIHGFWESRLPELFFQDYDLLTGRAEYVEDLQAYAWQAVVGAHEALDSVFRFEKELTDKYPPSKKYGYEERGNRTIRTYSHPFSHDYHRKLSGMVERQMRRSIKMTGDFWFSCWVKAGQPDLDELIEDRLILEDTTSVGNPEIQLRNHEAEITGEN